MSDDETGAATRRRVAAVLFDMDGTLLDSEPSYFESDRAFLETYGIDYDEEMNASFIGRGSMEMMRTLARTHPGSALNGLSLEERIRLKDEAYARFAPSRVSPFPAVVDLAKALAGMGVPLAIASGSSPDVIALMLEASGLGSLFPIRVSSAEVPRGKPEPDIFVEAARRCGVAPEACLVLEDSRYGVAAALTAGMACVALPAPGSPGPEDFAVADMVIEGGAAALDYEAVLRRFAWAPSA